MGRLRSCVFMRIFTVAFRAYFRLSKGGVKECTAGLEMGPTDLAPIAGGVRNREKSYYENTKKSNFAFYPYSVFVDKSVPLLLFLD